MNKFYTLLLLSLGVIWHVQLYAQSNPTPVSTFPYSQNFNGITAYPAGWQGWQVSGSLSTTVSTAIPSGNQTFSSSVLNSSTSNSVGLYNGDRLGFLSTGSAIRAIALALNTTGQSGITVKYNAATQRSAGRIGRMVLQYRIGTSGTFTTIDESEYFNTGSSNTSGSGFIDSTTISVLLPTACDNKAVVQLRWIMSDYSGSGDRPGFSIDNVVVTVTPPLCTAPTGSPEGFSDFSVPDQTSIELEWLNGNGAGRVIVMNTVNSFTNLSEGADPAANTVYGGGEQVVYNDTGYSPVVISGLLPGTKYYFKGYEYCSPDRVYKNDGAVDSITTEAGSNTITTEASVYGPFCNGTAHNINVAFTSEGTFTGAFKVQLSDAGGIFPPNTVDNIIGSGASPITATIPVNTPAGNGYRVRVIHEDPLTLGDDNGSDIVIATTPGTPDAATPAPVCEGASAVITGAGSANAAAYTFWDSLSGGNQIVAGVTGNTLTTSGSLVAGTYTYYIQGENASCVSLARQPVEVIVHAVPAVPSGTFTYSANPSCEPATIGFDAGYYFQTSPAGTSQSFPTSSPYTLNATGTIYVRAFNGNCWSAALASDPVAVNSNISITTQPVNTSINSGSSGTISVVAANVSSYQWQVNDGCGWVNLSNTGNYSGVATATLTITGADLDMTGLLYRVLLTASAPCTSLASDQVTLTVTQVGANIWTNNITGSSPGNTNPYTTNQSVTAHLTVSGIGRSGVSGTGGNDRYNTNSWSTAFDANKYITWTLTPASGYSLNISVLEVNLQSSGSGPNQIAVRTSLDNFASNIYTSAHPTSASAEFYSINIGVTNQTGPVEVRLYAYGSSAGTFSVNDFVFKGTVNAICTPPAITVQPHDISACYNQFSVETSAADPEFQWQWYNSGTSTWEKILICDSEFSDANTNMLVITGDLSQYDGVKFRAKVIADNCPAYSDEVIYSVEPILLSADDAGDITLGAGACDYNGWTYYTKPEYEGRYAFAVNWAMDGTLSAQNALAKADAEVVITNDANFHSNEALVNGEYLATYTMSRYWNIHTTDTIDEPVSVKFVYKQAELDAIVAAANAYVLSHPGANYEGFAWFKTVGNAFVPSASVNSASIINSIRLTDEYMGESFQGFKVAQFNNITSFSGGTGATGVGPLLNNPLPVELMYFEGNCEGRKVLLSWGTASELNADKFIVQGSSDGRSFTDLGTVPASGNSSTPKYYGFVVSSGVASHFRLKEVDFDGREQIFKIISPSCDQFTESCRIYYSTAEGVILQVERASSGNKAITITGVNGQVVYSKVSMVGKGNNRITIPVSNLPKGVYVVNVSGGYDSISEKVVVY